MHYIIDVRQHICDILIACQTFIFDGLRTSFCSILLIFGYLQHLKTISHLAVVTDIDGQLTNVELPKVDHADQFDRYRSTTDELNRYHEAGYNPWTPNGRFFWVEASYFLVHCSRHWSFGPKYKWFFPLIDSILHWMQIRCIPDWNNLCMAVQALWSSRKL